MHARVLGEAESAPEATRWRCRFKDRLRATLLEPGADGEGEGEGEGDGEGDAARALRKMYRRP